MLELLFDVLSKVPHVLTLILALFTVFIVHELGHYFAAKLCFMKVEHFAVGYGRRLWYTKDGSGTRWSFHMFPLGGHVLISALSFEEHSAAARVLWQRTLVVLAGPLANMVLPFVILPLCFMMTGYPVSPPVISGVETGLPAAQAGFLQNDGIKAINGKPVISYEEVVAMINDSKGAPLRFDIVRGKDDISLTVTPVRHTYTDKVGILRDRYKIGILNVPLGLGFSSVVRVDAQEMDDDPDLARTLIKNALDRPVTIGITMDDDVTHTYSVVLPSALNAHLDDPDDPSYDIFFPGPVKDNGFVFLSHERAVLAGFDEAASLLGHLIKVPFQIFPLDPVMFSEQIKFLKGTEHAASSMLYKYAYMVAMISFIIGFFNLLPLPRLDGDYLVAYLLEGIKKRPPRRKERAAVMGVSLFTIYAVFLLYNLGDFPQYVTQKIEKMQTSLEEWREPE